MCLSFLAVRWGQLTTPALQVPKDEHHLVSAHQAACIKPQDTLTPRIAACRLVRGVDNMNSMGLALESPFSFQTLPQIIVSHALISLASVFPNSLSDRALHLVWPMKRRYPSCLENQGGGSGRSHTNLLPYSQSQMLKFVHVH